MAKQQDTSASDVDVMLVGVDMSLAEVLAQPVIRLLEGDNHGARRVVPPDSSRRPALPAR